MSHNFKKVVSCACSHRVLSTASTALFEQKLPQDFCERKNVGFWLKNAWKFTFTWKSERRSNEFLDTILLSSLGIRRRTSIEKKRLCPATDREKVTKCESSGLERVRLQKNLYTTVQHRPQTAPSETTYLVVSKEILWRIIGLVDGLLKGLLSPLREVTLCYSQIIEPRPGLRAASRPCTVLT